MPGVRGPAVRGPVAKAAQRWTDGGGRLHKLRDVRPPAHPSPASICADDTADTAVPGVLVETVPGADAKGEAGLAGPGE